MAAKKRARLGRALERFSVVVQIAISWRHDNVCTIMPTPTKYI